MGENNKRARAGIRWDNVVEKNGKDLGGDQEEVLMFIEIDKFGGYKTVTKRIEEREKLALRNQVKEEKHVRDIRGVEGRYWNEKRKRHYTSSREEEGLQIYVRVAQQ